MRTTIKMLTVLVVILGAFVVHHRYQQTSLSYWQERAAKVHLGMVRTEAEKLLPLQVPNDSVLWQLENLREVHTPRLPQIKKMLAFQLWHGGNLCNWEEYEVSKGIFVGIGYDMAGSTPPHTPKGRGVLQPGDRVISLPKVTTQSSGYPYEFFR